MNKPYQSLSPGVMIYGGRSYAVGLVWFTVQDEEAAKALLKSRLKSLGSDFYCNRLHISQQQGFGGLKQGHKRGMPVAAAVVADQLVGEWHGVFEAENGWWYVQVRSDTVMPHGDRFYLSEEEAYNVFQEEMTKHNWPHAYAPSKWRLPEGTARELSLKNVLGGFEGTTLNAATMTARFGGAKQRNVVFGALCAIGLLLAGITLKTVFIQPDLDMPTSSAAIRQNRPVIKAAEVTNAVDPKQLLELCGRSLAELAVPLPGWRMNKFVCMPTAIRFLWTMSGGSLEGAKEFGFKQWPKNVNVFLDTAGLTASIIPEKLPTLESAQLLSQEKALLILESDLKPMGQLKVKPTGPGVAPVPGAPIPPPPPRPVPDANGVIPPPPPPPKPMLEVDFSSGFDPREVGPYLIGKPGLEILEITWDINRALWQYKIKWMNEVPPPLVFKKVDPVVPGANVTPLNPKVATPPAANAAATTAATPAAATATTTPTPSQAVPEVAKPAAAPAPASDAPTPAPAPSGFVKPSALTPVAMPVKKDVDDISKPATEGAAQ